MENDRNQNLKLRWNLEENECGKSFSNYVRCLSSDQKEVHHYRSNIYYNGLSILLMVDAAEGLFNGRRVGFFVVVWGMG